MSIRLHPTKNKHLKPGEWQWYQIVTGRGKDRETDVLQFESRAAAQMCDNELKRIHRPDIQTVVAATFEQMLPDFLLYYENELERRPRAIEAWLQGWNNLKPHFGHLKPNHLTPSLIELYKAHRLKQKAGIRSNLVCKRTVQKELHVLSGIVKYATDKNLCEPLTFKIRGFLKKHTEAAPVIPPTPEQVAELFKKIKRTDYLDLYQSLYYTGCRSEEMRTLQRKHVYLEWNVITVFGKGGKWRIIPIVGPYVPIITRLCKDKKGEAKNPEDYILTNPHTGKPFSPNIGRLDAAGKAAGIQTHITPHVLRKCFSTHCIHWGCDMRTLQMILGHADVKTTEKYTFLPPSILAAKLSSFGELKTTNAKTEQNQLFAQCTNKTPDNYQINQLVST